MSRKFLCFDCNNGIAGDMTVAALVGVGVPQEVLRSALDSLGVEGLSVAFGETVNHGFAANTFRVDYPGKHECHHGEERHEHGHEHHHHEHRHLADIETLIERGKLSARAKELALQMFRIVAEAEAEAHGLPIEEVHFHEVGAYDSIADIVSVAVAVDYLDVASVVFRNLTDGCGTIHCAHGELPVPVPAVVNILFKYAIPLAICEVPTELVTPTGAAIVAALGQGARMPSRYVVKAVGAGAGEREIGRANLLRAMLLEETATETPNSPDDEVWVLETNVDDATGEQLAFTAELLLEHGARDAHFTPVFMKKGRPGWQLTVLADESKLSEMEGIIFANTTTIGVRRYRCERTCLARKEVVVNTSYGEARVKKVTHQGQTYLYPEYDSVRALARLSGKDFKTIYAEIQREALGI
ncbi:MAG: nickel pincer cofactor biosynthesis protein LarC [Victivallales bacterium]|nr:nickel pincer cofactor biosynthesis protein LarC [Victivallales bacterium]